MFCKKIISVLVSTALMFALPITSYAYTTEDIDNGLFISENMAEEIQTSMYDDDIEYYQFLYSTNDVIFDFSHAMPYYVLDYSKSLTATKSFDMVVYSGYCIVPTIDAAGKFIAYTEFKQIPTLENSSVI